jgi:hypothetical protein
LPTESAEMSPREVIHRSENFCIGWSEIDSPQIFFMQLSIGTNYTLAVNNDCLIIKPTREQPHFCNERQLSVNDFWIRKQLNWKVICSLLFTINRLVAFVGKRDSRGVTATFWYWASTERSRYFLWLVS